MQGIDRELQVLGDAQMRGPRYHDHWARFDSTLGSIYGEKAEACPLIKENDRDGHSIYTSPQWPVELTAAELGILETEGISTEPEFFHRSFLTNSFKRPHGKLPLTQL